MHLFIKNIVRRFHHIKLREVAVLVLLLIAIPLTVVLVNSQKDIRQHASDSFVSCTDDSQCSSGNTCFHYASYPGTCKPAGTVCEQVIVRACDPKNPSQCDDFPNSCVVPPGWTTGITRGNTTSTFTVSSNPCILKADGTCSIKLSWSVSGATDVSIKVKGTSVVWTVPATGVIPVEWITAGGVTFELYSGSTLLQTVTAFGVVQNKLSASPSPCILNTQGTCTSTLFWSVPSASGVIMKVKGTSVVWNLPATGVIPIEWITATGGTFELYSGETLVDTITVKGVTQNTINASDCILSAEGVCTSTLFWSTDKKDSTIRVRGNPPIVWNVPASGSLPVTWITAGGVTFELFSGETPLSKIFVKGITKDKLSASPNPCSFQAEGTCTSTIYWNSEKTDITVTADPGANTQLLFGAGPVGAQPAPWINAQGVTFRLYSGKTLLDTLVVKGVCAPPFCRLKP